jgi:hypothetical protein
LSEKFSGMYMILLHTINLLLSLHNMKISEHFCKTMVLDDPTLQYSIFRTLLKLASYVVTECVMY